MPRSGEIVFSFKRWRSNKKIAGSTFAQRGCWLEVMGLMMDGEQYGVLTWDVERIARAVHAPINLVQSLADDLIMKGSSAGKTCEPFVYTDSYGLQHELVSTHPGPIWYSSALVRDKFIREAASKCGRKGGNPRLKPSETLKGPETLNPTLKGTLNPSPPSPPPDGFSPNNPSSFPPPAPPSSAALRADFVLPPKSGTPGFDPLDGEVRAFLGGHKFLIWDPRTHAECRKLVTAIGWPEAERLIEQGIDEGKNFPVGWAAGCARNKSRADAAAKPRAPKKSRQEEHTEMLLKSLDEEDSHDAR